VKPRGGTEGAKHGAKHVKLQSYERGFQELKSTPLVLPPLKVVTCGAKANIL